MTESESLLSAIHRAAEAAHNEAAFRTDEPQPGLAGTVFDSQFITTLRLLALPHADHPDYRPEWRSA